MCRAEPPRAAPLTSVPHTEVPRRIPFVGLRGEGRPCWERCRLGPVLARSLQAGVRARPVPHRAPRDTAERGQVDSGVSKLSALQDRGLGARGWKLSCRNAF